MIRSAVRNGMGLVSRRKPRFFPAPASVPLPTPVMRTRGSPAELMFDGAPRNAI